MIDKRDSALQAGTSVRPGRERAAWTGAASRRQRQHRAKQHLPRHLDRARRSHNRAVAERHRAPRGNGGPAQRSRGGEATVSTPRQPPAADALTGPGNARALGTWAPVCPAPAYRFNNFGFEVKLGSGGPEGLRRGAAALPVLRQRQTQVQKGLGSAARGLSRPPRAAPLRLQRHSPTSRISATSTARSCSRLPTSIPLGFIQVNGPRFDELAARCAWTIYPTCSDGQAGSTVQCMHAGLVPMRDPGGGASTPRTSACSSPVTRSPMWSGPCWTPRAPTPDWVRERAARTRSVALAEYSAEAFAVRWREIVEEVTAGAQALRGQPGH